MSSAKAAVAALAELIAENQFSSSEQNCTGTSICFPQFDSQRAEHLADLVGEYEKLDFARDTGWDKLIAMFLSYQEQEVNAALALLSSPSLHPPDQRPPAGPRPNLGGPGRRPPIHDDDGPSGNSHTGNGHAGNGHGTHGPAGRNI